MEFIQIRSICVSKKAVPEKLFSAAQVTAEAHWTEIFNTLVFGLGLRPFLFHQSIGKQTPLLKIAWTRATETGQLKHPAREGLRGETGNNKTY